MRGWIEGNMRDYYLFAEQVPRVRPEDFDSDVAILEALRVDPPDRYSYLADEAEYDALFEEGETFGLGWRLVRTGPDTWLFARVLPGSPLDRAGVARGDRLIAIDGIAPAAFAELTAEEQDRRLGTPAAAVDVTFTIESAVLGRYETTVRAEPFPLVTVPDVRVLEREDGTRLGYLHLTEFLETSMPELSRAFETLAGVDELLLDLRYNGGGRVSVAGQLAGAVAGRLVEGEVFARFRHNATYACLDQHIDFEQSFAALDLPRVFVLTSERTCSASELVINALEPFIDVVTIGRRTCGKPYATSPRRSCGRVLNALEVRMENSVFVGDYVDGLEADCGADDDPSRPQGRPGDPLHDAVLAYIDTGACALLAGSDDAAKLSPSARAAGRAGLGTEPRFSRQPLLEGAVLP